ncbi:MAG: ATP-binding cassette domain-containing protein [Alphaproteobacteria bacterium]|nr:ATP-binding cassette domain-containing protein [Alphaproteobacteria bacterium]
MSVVKVQHLNHYYGEDELRFQVLKDVSLTINPGEVTILTGPSGSGKTTLLTLIGGLRKAEEGSVNVMGSELVHSSEATRVSVRRHIGFIFQQHNLITALTAEQNVCMALELNDRLSEAERKKRAAEMLREVGLGDRMNFKPAKLSGGQRQRVSIARALANDPKLILADEPTASLDKANGQEAVRLLRKLAQEKGCAILLVTHDYRILDMAERIIELEDGRITQKT